MDVKLNTTTAEFHELHQKVDGARAGSKEVKVSKEALWHLLLDHSALHSAATKNHAKVTETEE